MSDNEIIKALKGSILNAKRIDCKAWSLEVYKLENALDLINRQKAEIEGLEETRYELACIIDELLMCIDEGKETKSAKPIDINEIKSEAVKEFAERLKEKLQWDVEFENKLVFESDIENLVKEMTE